MGTHIKINRILPLLLLWLYPLSLPAQNEVEREINSLKGIQAMRFRVNYGANASLSENQTIDAVVLQEAGEEILQDGNITLIPNDRKDPAGQGPLLHLHINAMDAGRGLIPFAISLKFYQPVKLPLNRDLQTSASTWESSTLGLVSQDQLQVIEESARGLLREFRADFNEVNGRNRIQ
ncbi:MAG TPA: hypothetical protein VK112_11300 [Fodinibius sp.]|nr:hypothetical protein [Fodinibius sp.]